MSALESSVTLEDVFAVVEAKRVPLAPELAGYLTLEIADGADAGGGDVDPRTVFISEEGTVALVRPKSNPAVGDAETSVRHILAKLLEASGSATPALGVAAKRKTPAGMPALVEELEAALIPVNRAAGRRALARLAREVKRVTMGVGRNAAPRSAPGGVPTRAQPEPEIARPRVFEDEAATAKRPNQLAEVAAQLAAPELVNEDARRPRPIPAQGLTPPPHPGGLPGSSPAPALKPSSPAARPSAALPPPPSAAPPVVPPPRRRESGTMTAAAAERKTPDKLLGDDEVENLLATFEVKAVGEKEMSRDLKAIAGLEPTPPPPDAKTLADLTKDVGKDLPKSLDGEKRNVDESVDDLLAAAASAPSASPPHVAPSPKSPPVDPVEDLLALADASAVPETKRASTPEAPNVAPPVAPSPAAPPVNPLAPPSPLVPSAALGRPLAEASARTAARSASGLAGESTGRRPAPFRESSPESRERLPSTGATTTRRRAAEPRAPKTAMALLSIALLALLATAGAIWWKAPYVFTGGRKKPVPSATPAASVTPAPAPQCKVALVLGDVPAGAEILLRVGQAPVDVQRMPMKTRLEFVATAEGHAPRRAVVRADATWDSGPDGKPRIEVPIQLDPSKARPGQVDPWPAAEPGSEVGGTGAPGTVHVVSNVRGAEIWLLAGLGPEARIEQLRCEGDIDVLIAGQPANARKRLHVAEKDVQAAKPDAQGNRIVTLSAK